MKIQAQVMSIGNHLPSVHYLCTGSLFLALFQEEPYFQTLQSNTHTSVTSHYLSQKHIYGKADFTNVFLVRF